MFINDIHILFYFFIGILGLLVGQFLDWANIRLEEHKKVICKEFFKDYLPSFRINIKTAYPTALIYVALLYIFGWQFELLKFLILTPMFISVFVIDYRKQIIPNRLNLTIFEVGIVFAFIAGFQSMNIFVDRLLGMCAGAGIFFIITLIGGLIAGKEAMGFGDVKLMGALGIIFGLSDIIMIAVVSFLVGAIISITLLVSKKKKTDEYIPFGPFIIIASFVLIFIPSNWVMFALLKVFSLGLYKG